jgi:hypothetical protein
LGAVVALDVKVGACVVDVLEEDENEMAGSDLLRWFGRVTTLDDGDDAIADVFGGHTREGMDERMASVLEHSTSQSLLNCSALSLSAQVKRS